MGDRDGETVHAGGSYMVMMALMGVMSVMGIMGVMGVISLYKGRQMSCY